MTEENVLAQGWGEVLLKSLGMKSHDIDNLLVSRKYRDEANLAKCAQLEIPSVGSWVLSVWFCALFLQF